MTKSHITRLYIIKCSLVFHLNIYVTELDAWSPLHLNCIEIENIKLSILFHLLKKKLTSFKKEKRFWITHDDTTSCILYWKRPNFSIIIRSTKATLNTLWTDEYSEGFIWYVRKITWRIFNQTTYVNYICMSIWSWSGEGSYMLSS